MQEQETCQKCGQVKQSKSAGTITQWVSVCQCDLLDTLDLEEQITCKNCGRSIFSSRQGSLTQWVFRANSCDCKLPEPVKVNEYVNQLDNTVKLDQTEYSYMELSSEEFPVDRFKPIKKLGEGGKGLVYLAFDERLTKQVAVKVLLNCSEDELVAFQKEAKVTAKLNHTNIIDIVDFGVTKNSLPYMVLEYSEGMGLDEILKKSGPPEVLTAIDIFLQIARALDYGHGKGVYHRDIKVSNILFVASDEESSEFKIQVIDFGVAALIGSQHTTSVQGRTMVGTPKYMPPDQALGDEYDARSEIYSFGCLMYELLTGKPPFEGVDVLDLISKHATEKPVPLHELELENTFGIQLIEPLVLKCLEKKKEARFATCKELIAELTSIRAKIEHGLSIDLDQNDSAIVEKKQNAKVPYTKPLIVSGICSVLTGIIVSSFMINKPENKLGKTMDKVITRDTKDPVMLSYPEKGVESPEPNYQIVQESGKKSFHPDTNLNFSDKDLSILDKLEGIEAITLNRTSVNGSGLVHALKHPVHTLNMRESNLNDAGMRIIAKMKDLRYLILKKCVDVTDKGFAKVSRLPLTNLDLSHTNLSDKSIRAICDTGTVEQLDISFNESVTADGIRALRRLSKLKLLFVSFDNRSLEFVKALSELSLDGLCVVGDRGKKFELTVDQVKLLKPGYRYIKFLTVKLNRATIAEIGQFENLETLDLFSNGIRNTMLFEVRKLPVQYLGFYDQLISDVGLDSFNRMKNLKTLSLASNRNITQEGLLEFLKAKPKYKVLLGDNWALCPKEYNPFVKPKKK